jgi:5'-nucleotidase
MKTALVIVVASLAGAAAIVSARQPRAQASSVSVQILAFNDFHGNLEPPGGANGLVNGTPAGGVEYLATHLARAAAANPNTIVVQAGDVIGASPLVSGLFHDEPTIEAMNALHLSVASVGNHEFDHGASELRRMQRGGCHPVEGCRDGDRFGGASFEYLAANVRMAEDGAPLFPASVVRTVGGINVGFIGETLRGTPEIVAPAGVRGLRFLDEVTSANQAAAELDRRGVHAIVLLIHQGGRQEPADGSADPNGCDHMTGPIQDIVSRLSRSIKVVVAGHTHQFFNCQSPGRSVTSAGAFGRLYTRIELTIDRASDTIAKVTATNAVVTRDVPKDPAETAILAKYERLSSGLANQVVGSVASELLRRPNAAGESTLGDVIADSMLASTGAPEKGGAVVAFMNSGGIRADLAAAASSRRDVRYGDLYAVQPFGNALTVMTMTGDMIRRLLEQQFERPSGAPPMLQVSSGFTYRYRSQAVQRQHVDPGSLAIAGRAVGPRDRIRVATLDFLAAGSDGFTVFREGTERIGGEVDIDALTAYFRAHSPVSAPALTRLVRLD